MKIEEVSEIVTQLEEDDRTRDGLYKKIDDAVECKFVPDPAIAALPFISGRKFALTDIADARNAGTRVFTSLLPNINISPTADNEGEYERVDRMETAWGWELERMNTPLNGKKGAHDRIVESATTYHAMAMQTEYLPYKFKGVSDPRTKAILSRKCFNWVIHHPKSVHSKWSDYGLERVAKVATLSALELIEKFGEENPGVMKLKADLSGRNKRELMIAKYRIVDYTDWKVRAMYAEPSGGKGHYEFMNAGVRG